MKKIALLFILFAFSSLCYAQQNYFQYKLEKFDDEANKFSFPIFSNSSNRFATAKVNQMLQIAELELLKGFETKNIFEQVSIDDGRIYGGKVDIDFKVFDNNSKVLSVKLNESSCGATCTYWVKYYNFNSGNGDLIQLKDLFTKKGYEKFFALATKRRIAQLKNEIRKMPLAERGDFEGISGSYEADDLMDFHIKKNVLYIDGENSFSKNQKFASLEINRISQFKLSEFKSYLNDYGKSLFRLNKDSIKKYRSNVLPQLFQGKIGEQKVLLVLNNGYENEMKAEYVYAKYGKGIYVEGKIKANELSLTEKLARPKTSGFIDYVDNGFIKARFDGQNIIGTWTDKEKLKMFDLQLTRK
jgi:hypothetical protein